MADKISRREVIAGAGASALALTGGGFAPPPMVARGVVFEDRHGDGQRRPNAAGIPGVMVSNGRDVVLTQANGGWQLRAEPGDAVFVIKPPDWETPALEGGRPRFSHVMGPAGSPAPSFDFALRRRAEPRDFDAILVSDTQPDSAAELDYVRDDIVAAMLGIPAAFGINHGDVVSDDLSLYPRYLQVLGATGMPWHHCPGNHDLDHGAVDDRLSRETWKRVFGARHYAFQHADTTVLMLDNVEYIGRASGRYRGWFGPRQLAFVRNVLAHVPREHLIVLCMHIPLRCYLDPHNPADTTADYAALLRLLEGRPHTVSFAGHLHATEHHYLGADAGFGGPRPHHHHVLTAASGSWWSGPRDHRGIPFADSSDGTPNGFHVLSVSGNAYRTRFVPSAGKSPGQLRVAIEGPHRSSLQAGTGLAVPVHMLGQSRILANLFDGGPKTHVTFQIVGAAPPMPMHAAAVPDPMIRDLFAGDCPRKPWVQAVASSHIWQADLPATLKPGAHVLQICARDEYGREHTARSILQVVAPQAMAAAVL